MWDETTLKVLLREKENTRAVRFLHPTSLFNKGSLGQGEHMDCFVEKTNVLLDNPGLRQIDATANYF